MKLILKKAGQPPRIIDVEDDLKSLQSIVGGYIEVVKFFPTFYDNILFICDEEGKLKGKAVNFFYGRDAIVGDVLFAGSDGNSIIGLNDTQIKAIMAHFKCNQNCVIKTVRGKLYEEDTNVI